MATVSGFPRALGRQASALRSSGTADQRALGTGPPETCWLEDLKPLATASHGRARGALVPCGPRSRLQARETLLRRMPARRRGHTSAVGLQTQVREDLLDHWLFEDRCDGLQFAAAVRAVFQVDLESEASAKTNFSSSDFLIPEDLGLAQDHTSA